MARQLVSNSPRLGARQARRPSHDFNIKFQPFDIQPFMLAPVMPGDSFKSLSFQARIVTDPIANPVTGWWAEAYFFYVRFSDLDEYDDAQALIVDPTYGGGSLYTTAQQWCYHNGTGINWLHMAMKPITRQFFRIEGDDWDVATRAAGGPPLAAIASKSWTDGVVDKADLSAAAGTSDYEDRWEYYEQLRRAKLVSMSFEEFLRSQGVDVPEPLKQTEEDKRRPELIRYVREFVYPTNTVNPADGSAASAVSWLVSERADKRRFFDQPGFIVGVMCARPKVYRSAQRSNGSSLLTNGRLWAPAVFAGDAPQETLVETTGGVLTTAQTYIADMAQLYQLGDQFTNIDLTAPGSLPVVALPRSAAGVDPRYPTAAETTAMFVDQDPGTAQHVHADGRVSLSLTGHLTAGTNA